MCLLNPSKQKIAKKDITCYTIVHKIDNSYLSPYYHVGIKLGVTMTSDLLHGLDPPDLNLPLVIQIGLHSFNHLKNAKDMNDILWNSELVVLKNIIPKGAKYYSGTFNGYAARASNKRIAIEEVSV